MVSFLMDERHFSLLCIVVEDNGDYIKALVPFLSEHLHLDVQATLQGRRLRSLVRSSRVGPLIVEGKAGPR